jgi:hypothetical protein
VRVKGPSFLLTFKCVNMTSVALCWLVSVREHLLYACKRVCLSDSCDLESDQRRSASTTYRDRTSLILSNNYCLQDDFK